jgi:acyl-coenzyme A thioesterase PaaI-like protein
MTLSLTTNFIASVKAGRLYTEGRRTGGGKSVFFAEGEVRDAEDRLIATATGTFKYLSSPLR